MTRHERRRQRTRALIRETAWELFVAHGYDATTIKAIADAADVAPRTVTMHFPAKDDLLFADDDYFGADRLERRLTARPAGQQALEALRHWMVETIDDIGSSRADRADRYWHARAQRARLIDENDRLRGLARASYSPMERILAAAIADDLHVEPDALGPRLAATTAVTGLRELYDSHEARSLGPQPTGGDLIRLVNEVVDYAIAGLAAVTVEPA
ncbi:TetR/AcrR family transcriptional regulator [Pseudonocardia acaciae]|uniref:TetR/AcrR family transcriptional regulator n=1 Tax=Pseudonocardia acaciae TaxID=551276 RepID=UPI00048B69EF|nr:TetR/AcrR family transcriptional regulator [Pseudonocardia acaciae]